MTQIYLDSLNLTEFRNFANLSVKLSPKPSVMLVHGTNGLGKSSLFDGIEWALTGKIEHFARSARGTDEAHYLRRWRAQADRPTAIKLSFSDDRFIQRTLGSDKVGGESDVAAYLKSADWQQSINDLQRYLLLTHFLGQSTMSRMTHRDPVDRWEFLQEPAQSDWATKITKTLHGHGASIHAKAYEKLRAAYTEEAVLLENLLSQEALAFDESRISGAIDDNTAGEVYLAVLHELEPILVWLGVPGTKATDFSLEQAQDTLQRLLHSVLSAIVKRRAALEQGEKLTKMQALLQSERVTTAAALTAARDELSASQSTFNHLKERVTAIEADVSAARITEQFCNDSVARLKNLIERYEHTLRMHAEIDLLETQLVNAEVELEEAASDVAKEEHRRDISLRLDRELLEIAQEVENTSKMTEALQEAIQLTQVLRQRGEEINRIEAEQIELAGLLDTNQREIYQSKSDVIGRSKELASARQSVDELSAAVAQVAALLPPESCTCPVCDTHLKTAGALQAKALAAASRLAPSLALHEQALQRAKDKQRSLTVEGENLRLRQQANNEARETISGYRAALRKALNCGLGHEANNTEEKELITHLATVASWGKALLQRQERKQRWRQHSILAAGSGTALRHALSHRSTLELEVNEMQRQRDQLRSEATSATASIRLAMAGLLNTPETDPAMLRDAIKDEELRLENARVARQSTHAAFQQATEATSAANEQVAIWSARVTELQRSRDVLIQTEAGYVETWAQLDLPGVSISDREGVQRMGRELFALDANTAQLRLRIDHLREGRIAWSRNQNHRAALIQLRQRAGGTSGTRDETRAEILRLQAELNRKASAVQRAKEIAHSSFTKVSTRVQEFNEEYLRPLSLVMGKFNKAILSDQNIGFELQVAKKKINQISRQTHLNSGLKEVSLDPHLVHSEGQMAALAVSMLCASSLAFPWSRWRGLVLDDPLQHNDVIRSAAFADIACNLIKAQQYQILLSTHDFAQAQFLRRKFDAQGIPMTMVHLRGKDVSDNGTQVEISYFNMDADDQVVKGAT